MAISDEMRGPRSYWLEGERGPELEGGGGGGGGGWCGDAGKNQLCWWHGATVGLSVELRHWTNTATRCQHTLYVVTNN